MPQPSSAHSPLVQLRLPPLSRRALLLAGLFGAALPACASRAGTATGPLGNLVSVELIDRETRQPIEVHLHRGGAYVAGRPGARYAIRISNRTPGRLLVVTAVDGINILSGQTAAWGQTGYVFGPWQTHDLTGWRKSDQQVAAFEFTALPDSYAARTGRPLDVGVIGVAVFRERPPAVVQAPMPAPMTAERRADRSAGSGTGAESDRAESARLGSAAPEAARERLGTGHGEREYAPVTRTAFERASATPAEVVSLQYDRWENLVAAGIIPAAPDEQHAGPRPFPGSRDNVSFVPDPPRR